MFQMTYLNKNRVDKARKIIPMFQMTYLNKNRVDKGRQNFLIFFFTYVINRTRISL